MPTKIIIENLQDALKKVRKEAFLTDLSIVKFNQWLLRRLFLKYRGSDRSNPSFYNHLYKTSNEEEVVEIRISNHFAVESNMLDKNGNPKYTDAVSIVIETTENEGLHNFNKGYSKYYKEIVYTADCFDNEHKKKTIIEIIKGLISALKTGKYPDVKQGIVHIYRNEDLTKTTETENFE